VQVHWASAAHENLLLLLLNAQVRRPQEQL